MFSQPPLIAYKQDTTIPDMLVRSKRRPTTTPTTANNYPYYGQHTPETSISVKHALSSVPLFCFSFFINSYTY